MRLYVPATVDELLATEPPRRVASTVTPALRSALPEEDDEGLELSAFLTAADLSALCLAESGAAPRRVVLAVEVDPGRVRPGSPSAGSAGVPAAADPADLPSVLGVVDLAWSDVVAVHLDDDAPDVAALVSRAADDEDALEELGDVDLLWYDASELPALRSTLSPAPGGPR